MRAIHVFDIDNTIADNNHRLAYLKLRCSNCIATKASSNLVSHFCVNCNSYTPTVSTSNEFLNPSLVYEDAPFQGALQFVEQLRKHGASVYYITGRSESLREVTELWLQDKFCRLNSEKLYMRSREYEGSLASVSKSNSLAKLKEDLDVVESDMFTFYDDDPFVLTMYSNHGVVIKCPELWESILPRTQGIEFPF